MAKRVTIVVIFSIVSLLAGAGESNIGLELLGNMHLTLAPGKNSSFIARLTNTTEIQQEVSLSFSLPEGWNMLMYHKMASLPPNAALNKIFSFHVASNARTGDYKISLRATDGDGQLIDEKTILVTVSAQFGLLVRKFETPEKVFAGDSIRLQYLIQNTSNVLVNVHTHLTCGPEIRTNKYRIEPDSIVITGISTETYEDITQTLRQNSLLTASILEDPETEINLSHLYDILPSRELKFDPYERFPIKISFLTASNMYMGKRIYNSMYDIQGSSFISQKKRRRLAFQVRGPNRKGDPILGTHDSYFLIYGTPKHKITVGDQDYRLSSLTESSRYGRGAKYQFTKKDVSFSGFVNYPRFYPKIKRILSAKSSIKLHSKYRLSGAYLNKLYDSGEQAHLGTVSGSAIVRKWITVRSELAGGIFRDQIAFAYKSNVKVRFPFGNSYFNLIHADEDFPGYFSNTKNLSTGLSIKIKKRTNLSVNYSSSLSNMELDTLYANAPYSKNLNVSLNLKLHSRHSISISILNQVRQDRLEPRNFDYEENGTRITYFTNIKGVNLSLMGGYGQYKNHLDITEGELTNSFTANSSLRYNIGKRTSIDLFGNYQGNKRYLVKDLSNFYYGGAFQTKRDKVLLRLKYQSNYQIEEFYKDRSLLDLSTTFRFLRNHELSATSTYNLMKNSFDKKEFRFMLRYTYIFHAPMYRKENIGFLNGQIVNHGIESVEGITVTMNGNIAITNSEGKFYFPFVMAGESYLFIDDSKTGIKSISETPGPFLLNIEAGVENYFQVAYTKSASVNGRIAIEEDKNKDGKKYIDAGTELSNLIIEVKSKNEMFRVITDKDGEFKFPDLRPGEWTLKVYPNGIPEGYELITANFNMTLSPEEIRQVDIRIREKSRKVKFQRNFVKIK
jgi:hypothetical protein